MIIKIKFIEKMSKLIRQGIEKANGDLKKENDNKLVQQVRMEKN